MLDSPAFVERVAGEFEEHTCVIPLLVLRLPEFAEIAWRDGKRAAQRIERTTVRAFAVAAERLMRDGDLLAHEDGSDWFAVAMLSPARAGNTFGALDARAALERIAATMSLETGRRMESGWCRIESRAEIEHFAQTRERALERGARECERYEFLATVGHELRTPLTSIRGYIETLLDGDVDAQTSRRFLETARREALRLARLVDGMLEFSLLDLSQQSTRGATDLGAAVTAALDALAPIAHDAGVTLRSSVAERAWAAIDADACMHVLLNVVENGVKYCAHNGVVAVSLIREDPWVRIFVDDDGPGIGPGDRDRVFSYRERAHASEEIRGKGVGLAIVRSIVERAGGQIEVTASPLGGARFIVALPQIQADSPNVLS